MASRQLDDGGVLRVVGAIIFRHSRPFPGWQPVTGFLSPSRRLNPDSGGPCPGPWVATDGYGERSGYARYSPEG
jgi:hypothetical protein